MNNYAWVGNTSALFAIVAGCLLCFFGYRILKLSLALTGFIAGAYGGWQAGLQLFHGNSGTALICALVGGVIGMILCLLVFRVGVFCIGAAAGTAIAAAVFNGSGHQVQPLILLAIPLAFGIIALLAQKLMIVVCTAFAGAYLITAGIWPFVAAGPDASRIWLHPAQQTASATLGYGSLVVWVVLALVGIRTQFRRKREPEERPK